MTPSASPRCLAHSKHMARCTTCRTHLLAEARATTLTPLTVAA